MRYADCHTDRLHYSNGMCRQCYNRWYQSQPDKREKIRETKRKYRARNREKILAQKLRHRERYRKELTAKELQRYYANREEILKRRLFSKYNMEPGELAQILARQGGHCVFCETTELVVDHDHETQEVRGLLCKSHNQALGKFGDNLEGIMQVVHYLTGDYNGKDNEQASGHEQRGEV